MTYWLLYGATGYTGGLLAEACLERGLAPMLCGRNRDQLRALAQRLGLPYRVASLEDSAGLDRALSGMRVVLHAAGPFERTAPPMVAACLRNRVHYLDRV